MKIIPADRNHLIIELEDQSESGGPVDTLQVKILGGRRSIWIREYAGHMIAVQIFDGKTNITNSNYIYPDRVDMQESIVKEVVTEQ